MTRPSDTNRDGISLPGAGILRQGRPNGRFRPGWDDLLCAREPVKRPGNSSYTRKIGFQGVANGREVLTLMQATQRGTEE